MQLISRVPKETRTMPTLISSTQHQAARLRSVKVRLVTSSHRSRSHRSVIFATLHLLPVCSEGKTSSPRGDKKLDIAKKVSIEVNLP